MGAEAAVSTESLAIALIAKHEGFREKTYLCPGGHMTIGYGFSDPKIVKKGKMTRQEADKILGQYVRTYLSRLNMEFPWMTSHQKAAICSFIYNVGVGAFNRSALYGKLQQRDMVGAAAEILKWNHSKGKVLDGLTKRRTEESLWLSK